MLKRLKEFVEEANASNSTLDKKDVVRNYPDLKNIFVWTYSPYTKFNVTSKQIKKRKDLCGDLAHITLIALLQDLNERALTGYEAISAVNAFITNNAEYEEIIYSVIDKNLKTRTDAKLINSVFPKLIPTFNVALANKYFDRVDKVDFNKDTWYASRKLDGVRCIAIPDSNGKYSMFSRVGKEYVTLQKVVDSLNHLNSGMVFDGEICIVDDNGNEHFEDVMKEIRKKGHTIEHPRYKIFDCLTIEEFSDEMSNTILNHRIARYSQLSAAPYLDPVPQSVVNNTEQLMQMFDEAINSGWEGLIIRKDVGYEGKRTNNLLKVKKMIDAEYVVASIESGPFRIISKETGLEEQEEMLARVNITHKGNNVGVGSGFSIDQRRKYLKNPNEIVGKTITVAYFEETKDKDGNYSLRFPVVKHIYEDGRNV